MEFRLLRADEIDVRIAQTNEWGIGLLLYKDARCDMNILDETVGSMNWQRHHSRENANCIVSIWDAEKKTWIEKEDTGTESNTESAKGLASDSFKRACFNWGIGRELYTSPQMFVRANQLKTLKEVNGKWKCSDAFRVKGITYQDRTISSVIIENLKTNEEIAFSNQTESPIANEKIGEAKISALRTKMRADKVDEEKVLALYKIKSLSDMTERQFLNCVNNWEKVKNGI